ncbi:UNVERIFIED_CONTAM: hypothetical protein K2H54_026645 [Gekko kuhli]
MPVIPGAPPTATHSPTHAALTGANTMTPSSAAHSPLKTAFHLGQVQLIPKPLTRNPCFDLCIAKLGFLNAIIQHYTFISNGRQLASISVIHSASGVTFTQWKNERHAPSSPVPSPGAC